MRPELAVRNNLLLAIFGASTGLPSGWLAPVSAEHVLGTEKVLFYIDAESEQRVGLQGLQTYVWVAFSPHHGWILRIRRLNSHLLHRHRSRAEGRNRVDSNLPSE